MSALQCPGCGHIHNAGETGGGRTFRCGGCRRLLSVPATLVATEAHRRVGTDLDDATDDSLTSFIPGRTAGGDPWAPPGNGHVDRRPALEPDDWSDDETGPSAPAPPAAAPPKAKRSSSRVPRWMRALVWTAALTLGLLIAAALLRVAGILDVDSVIDAYAGRGLSRYSVFLVLVPLWAALSSGMAHVVLEWTARRRRSR